MKEPILAALAFALCGSFLLSLFPGEKKGASAFLSFLFSLSLLSLVLGPVLSLRALPDPGGETPGETSFAEGDRSWILEETAKEIGREVTAYLRVKGITLDLRAVFVTFDVRVLKEELSDLLDTPVTVLVR